MGCYKLTYEYETPLLFVEQGEKIDTLEWHVTVNAGSKLGEAEVINASSAGGPSLADLYLAGVGMAGWVAETQSDIVMGSRSGYTSGKLDPNSPNVYSKARATKIYYGAKAVGWGLTAWSVYSNYNQYKNGEIGESRFSYNNLNSGVGVFAPQFAIPMAAGDYLGQKYSTEITNDVSQPGGFLFEGMKATLEFLGIPTSAPGGK
jgi:hypothetical protein